MQFCELCCQELDDFCEICDEWLCSECDNEHIHDFDCNEDEEDFLPIDEFGNYLFAEAEAK